MKAWKLRSRVRDGNVKIMIGSRWRRHGFYLSLSAAAMAWICSCAGSGSMKFSGAHDPMTFVQTVAIKQQSGTTFFSGRWKGTPDNYTFEGEDEFGNKLITSWDGKKLTFEPKGKPPGSTLPFDFQAIALDMWRIASEWSDADIRRFNKNNFKGLPEGHVSFVSIDDDGFITVEKKITTQGRPLAEITYPIGHRSSKNPFMFSGDITLKNLPGDYELIIIQQQILIP